MEHAAPSAGNPALIGCIDREIDAAGGSLSFARFMELALYHPQFGYYMSSHRRPGRGGDFITSPEASPYFGHILARQFCEFWDRLQQPSKWSIREYGAGIGGLAYDIMAGLDQDSHAAFDALTYHLVEVNANMRAEAGRAMAEAGLAGKVIIEDPGLPLPPISGALLANEVADAFPVHRLVRRGSSWRELSVVRDGSGFGWTETALSLAAASAVAGFDKEEIVVPSGSFVDLSPAASHWFASAAGTLVRGFAMVIDYGYPGSELYRSHRLEGTVRGYFGHTVTDNPLIRVGEQDLTAHVDFTALRMAGESAGMVFAGLTTQGALLSSLELGSVLLSLQQDPETTMEEYLATQAVVIRLIDPAGLGRFRVLIMSRDVAENSNLRGLTIDPPIF